MKILFKVMSYLWIVSPVVFFVLRATGLVNVEHSNVQVFLILCGFSFVAMFFNLEVK